MLEVHANPNHRIYGKNLSIWVENRGRGPNSNFIGFSSSIPISDEQAAGRKRIYLEAFQVALTERLRHYRTGDGKLDWEEGGPVMGLFTKIHEARARIDHRKLEEVARDLIDIAHDYERIDDVTRATGLSRLQFVHEIRFDENMATPGTAFIGMKTDTKGHHDQIQIYYDHKKVSRDTLSALFACAMDSKVTGLGGGSDPRDATFQVAKDSTINLAASELLRLMRTGRAGIELSCPLLTDEQYQETSEALLLDKYLFEDERRPRASRTGYLPKEMISGQSGILIWPLAPSWGRLIHQ